METLINEIKNLRDKFLEYHNNPYIQLYYSLLASNYQKYVNRFYIDGTIKPYYKKEYDNPQIKKTLSKVNKEMTDLIKDFAFKHYNSHNKFWFPAINNGLKIKSVNGLLSFIHYTYLYSSSFVKVFTIQYRIPETGGTVLYSDKDIYNPEKFTGVDKDVLNAIKTILIDLIDLTEKIITIIKTNYDILSTIVGI